MPLTKVQSEMAAGGPAFSAYSNTTQNISAATWTKAAFNAEDYDTNTNYDAITNYRFMPTVSGYYQVNWSLDLSSGGSTAFRSMLYKNGSLLKYGNFVITTSGVQTRGISVGAIQVYMNGSTDYLEVFAYIDSGSGPLIAGNTTAAGGFTYFNGSLVRAA